MAQMRVKLIYPPGLVTKPIIAVLAKDHNVLANIRRASVDEGTGWLVCELEGEPDALKSGLKWLEDSGVEVESLGDVVES
ncbi:MAG: NIL domain-containing protein [Nitrospiraceae bacterium]|nr:NIL domain-containing protein [Nitrospiraceae bacterium]